MGMVKYPTPYMRTEKLPYSIQVDHDLIDSSNVTHSPPFRVVSAGEHDSLEGPGIENSVLFHGDPSVLLFSLREYDARVTLSLGTCVSPRHRTYRSRFPRGLPRAGSGSSRPGGAEGSSLARSVGEGEGLREWQEYPW